MKRLIAAALLLLLTIGIITASRITTEHYYSSFDERIKNCEQEYRAGNKKTAAQKAAEIEKDFEKAHLRLAAFINRETVDEIVLSVTRLESYAKLGDDLLFFFECETARMLLHHMLEGEDMTLLAIF